MKPSFAALTIFAMLAGGPVAAGAADPSSTVPEGVKTYAESEYDSVVTIEAFEGDFTGDGQPDALAFIYYGFTGGNAVGLDVSLFENDGSRLVHSRSVGDVFGREPRDVVIEPGRIEVTTTTLKPGEPRCCPTGETRHTIEP